jgi:glycosyltransferase 2 family protein
VSPWPQTRSLQRAIRAITVFVVLAAATYLSIALYVGWRDLADAFASLGAAALLAGLLVASLNYLLRFARWHDLLLRMGQRLPLADNLRIYVGGLALTATPGKVGETLRSALLLRWQVPAGASLAAFFVDRLTDLVGVLLLAAVTGGGVFWWALAAAAVLGGAGLRVAGGSARGGQIARWLERRHRLAGVVALVRLGLAQFVAVWTAPRVIAYVAIAMFAYGIQGLIFAAYVQRLWDGAQWTASLHIFSTATLAGAASMIPGGLGAMELALIAQLSLAGMPVTAATAAALAVRAVTLWYAILLGLLCLLWHRRRAVADTRPESPWTT